MIAALQWSVGLLPGAGSVEVVDPVVWRLRTGRLEVGDWLDHTRDVFEVEVGGAKLWRDGGRTAGGDWVLRACATASLAAFWAT